MLYNEVCLLSLRLLFDFFFVYDCVKMIIYLYLCIIKIIGVKNIK